MATKFGDFLYQLRKEKGMTQSQLADMLDLTNKAVSKWETGETMPETAQLGPLSNIFNVSIDELLKGGRNESVEQVSYIADGNVAVAAPLGSKRKSSAAVLAFVLGFGGYNFYLGYKKKGIIQLVISIVASALLITGVILVLLSFFMPTNIPPMPIGPSAPEEMPIMGESPTLEEVRIEDFDDWESYWAARDYNFNTWQIALEAWEAENELALRQHQEAWEAWEMELERFQKEEIEPWMILSADAHSFLGRLYDAGFIISLVAIAPALAAIIWNIVEAVQILCDKIKVDAKGNPLI